MKFFIKKISSLLPGVVYYFARVIYYTPKKSKTSRELQTVMNAAKHYTIPGNEDIVCYSWINSQNAPHVVLIHGWQSRASHLASFVNPLLDTGINVSSFDAPAHGESKGKRTNIFEMIKTIDVVISHANKQGIMPSIIAHSLGASAAVLSLKENPNLKVKKLTLISPVVYIDSTLHNFCKYLGLSDKVKRLFEKEIINKFGKNISELNIDKVIQSVKKPITIFHDPNDVIVPLSEVKVLNDFKEVEVIEIHGKGHFKIVKDENVIKEVIKTIN